MKPAKWFAVKYEKSREFDNLLFREARRSLLRLRKVMSVREVAAEVGKSPAYICMIEHGKRPGRETAIKIIEVHRKLVRAGLRSGQKT